MWGGFQEENKSYKKFDLKSFQQTNLNDRAFQKT